MAGDTVVIRHLAQSLVLGQRAAASVTVQTLLDIDGTSLLLRNGRMGIMARRAGERISLDVATAQMHLFNVPDYFHASIRFGQLLVNSTSM